MAAHEAVPTVAHGAELTVLREALPWAAGHEALPSLAGGQRRRDAVVAALVRLRNKKRKPTGR